jgi:hypothetical protein
VPGGPVPAIGAASRPARPGRGSTGSGEVRSSLRRSPSSPSSHSRTRASVHSPRRTCRRAVKCGSGTGREIRPVAGTPHPAPPGAGRAWRTCSHTRREAPAGVVRHRAGGAGLSAAAAPHPDPYSSTSTVNRQRCLRRRSGRPRSTVPRRAGCRATDEERGCTCSGPFTPHAHPRRPRPHRGATEPAPGRREPHPGDRPSVGSRPGCTPVPFARKRIPQSRRPSTIEMRDPRNRRYRRRCAGALVPRSPEQGPGT